MSDSTPPTPAPWVCPHCGAKQLGPATRCWLCEEPLEKAPREPAAAVGDRDYAAPYPPAAAGSPVSDALPERFNFSLATMLLIVTLASVAMGLLVALPGMGIFACIIMIPVFIRTMRVVRHRERMGETVAPGQKIVMFLGSYVVAAVVATLACIAAFCSFCGVCATMFAIGGGSDSNEAAPIAIMTILGAIASIIALVALVRWNRRRYRREIGEE